MIQESERFRPCLNRMLEQKEKMMATHYTCDCCGRVLRDTEVGKVHIGREKSHPVKSPVINWSDVCDSCLLKAGDALKRLQKKEKRSRR